MNEQHHPIPSTDDIIVESARDIARLRAEKADIERRISRRCDAIRRLIPPGQRRRVADMDVSVYRTAFRYDIVDPQKLPMTFWSRRPDRSRIAAAVRGGVASIPGVVCRRVTPVVMVRPAAPKDGS